MRTAEIKRGALYYIGGGLAISFAMAVCAGVLVVFDALIQG